MNIVGLIENEEELDQMEYIAKIFVIEQRMKEVSKEGRNIPVLRQPTYQLSHKININPFQLHQPLVKVRGLN